MKREQMRKLDNLEDAMKAARLNVMRSREREHLVELAPNATAMRNDGTFAPPLPTVATPREADRLLAITVEDVEAAGSTVAVRSPLECERTKHKPRSSRGQRRPATRCLLANESSSGGHEETRSDNVSPPEHRNMRHAETEWSPLLADNGTRSWMVGCASLMDRESVVSSSAVDEAAGNIPASRSSMKTKRSKQHHRSPRGQRRGTARSSLESLGSQPLEAGDGTASEIVSPSPRRRRGRPAARWSRSQADNETRLDNVWPLRIGRSSV